MLSVCVFMCIYTGKKQENIIATGNSEIKLYWQVFVVIPYTSFSSVECTYLQTYTEIDILRQREGNIYICLFFIMHIQKWVSVYMGCKITVI